MSLHQNSQSILMPGAQIVILSYLAVWICAVRKAQGTLPKGTLVESIRLFVIPLMARSIPSAVIGSLVDM